MQHFDIIYAGSCVLLLLLLVGFPQEAKCMQCLPLPRRFVLLCWRTLTTS